MLTLRYGFPRSDFTFIYDGKQQGENAKDVGNPPFRLWWVDRV